MHIGNAITSILLADMFDKNNQRGGHPLRPDKGHADYSRSRKKGQRASNSFAEHPERW
ncbi:MAG TPA: hypothetical protein VHQ23_15290 [Ilumatobacteraceae bacterium]|jgi:hypothetical protein|nr:hypothetical protein [Ilumatobacteraceae bacterium]